MRLIPIQPHSVQLLSEMVLADNLFLSRRSEEVQTQLAKGSLNSELLTHPRRLTMFLASDSGDILGFAVISLRGLPHSFAQVEIGVSQSYRQNYRDAAAAVSHFAFHDFATRSVQIPLYECETEKIQALYALGWTLDANLRHERLYNGLLVNELLFGKLRTEKAG